MWGINTTDKRGSLRGKSVIALMAVFCLAAMLLQGCDKKVIYGPGGGSYQGSSAQSAGTGTATTSDSTTGTAPRGSTPYTVLGQTYYPMLNVDSFVEEGIASWYGPDFHGKQTANGERYDMHGMTAAHKLLPFGTMVRVTSLENGKSVIVRINDRGPFVDNRIIDLTRSGAEAIDMLGPGTARVRIETIGAVQGLSKGELQGKFYVQIGAFSKEANAVGLVQTMGGRGQKARNYFSTKVNMWRVQVGPFPELSGAEKAADSLRGEYPFCFIVAD
ncbi:septal ring lytic transglycosylase RlpA family protein [Desulfovibrio sp. OttesenSCG-928-C06]|nr:septal ring lytic transglycosylase RlpA family protein [Desulfovibrio sp. OttesenSCG-928-C06]